MAVGWLAVAVLAALQAVGLAAEDWTQWAQCQHDPIPSQQQSASARRLNFNSDPNVYRDRYQLITINPNNGSLVINPSSGLWGELQALEEPVKIIVLFGQAGSGKSTVASMMSCAMNRDDAFLFPSSDTASTYTEGIWSSPPFDYTAADGSTSKYMIFDMQSLGRTALFQGKLDHVRTEHALYKLLAMLSEVASVFVQTLSTAAASRGDWEEIGGVFQTTRESILASSRHAQGGGAAANTNTDIKAHNQPAMIVLPRTSQDMYQMVMNPEFATNSAHYEAAAKTDFEALQTMPAFSSLMTQNFEAIDHNGTEYPFAYSSVPQIGERGMDGGKFNWANTVAYPYEEDGACAIYDRMWSSYWNCSIKSESVDRPSAPSTYRLMIEHLVGKVVEAGPVRMLQWKDQATPLPLTGARLQEVLLAGITEMNKVGPLPQTELWRKIMQDRCGVEVAQYLDFTYGELTGQVNGAPSTGVLAQIAEGLESLENVNNYTSIGDMDTEWRRLNALWTSRPIMEDAITSWFETKVLMKSVQPTCTKVGVRHALLLEEMYMTQVQKWGALEELRRRLDAEIALADARARIKALEWHQWWQEMRLYILLVAVGGFIALILAARVWRQCNATCRVCCMCCGDCGDTTVETTVVNTVHADGRIVTGIHHVTEGPRVPFPSALATTVHSGDKPSLSEERYQRLQGIDKTIEELKVAEQNAV